MMADSAREALLLCRVRTHLCGFPLRHVIETMRPLPLEQLAGMPAFVTGVSLIRGEPVPIVDPGFLLAGTHGARSNRLILMRTGPRRVAFAVEEVIGVRSVETDSLRELPLLLRDIGSAELIAELGTLDAELLLVMSAARVLADADPGAFGASEGSS